MDAIPAALQAILARERDHDLAGGGANDQADQPATVHRGANASLSGMPALWLLPWEGLPSVKPAWYREDYLAHMGFDK